MTQKFLNVNGAGLSGSNRTTPMIKTYSFTTDDDDAGSMVTFQTVSNHDKLLSMNSPSVDTNTNEDDVPAVSSQLRKRKSRRQTEAENHTDNRHSSIKKGPWYKKVDLSKPLMFVGLLILLYIMWIKRDVWIRRLLTSNTRIRPIITKNEQKLKESADSSKVSPSDSSDGEDTIENTEENYDIENNNEDLTASPTKSSSANKINIRTRKNKMSFSQEPQKKKSYRLQDLSVGGDNGDEEEEKDKEIEIEEPVLPPSTPSKKKDKSQSIIQNENSKSLIPLNSPLNSSTYNDIIKQLRENLKSRSRDRDFLSTLSKTIGLNKNKLYRFIYKKEYHLMTLQTFMSLLDSFNLMLLIVPK